MDDMDYRFLLDMTETMNFGRGAQRDRDDRIASLVRYRRASVVDIMRATGLTKSRIYQIFEQKYGFPVRAIDEQNTGVGKKPGPAGAPTSNSS